MSAIRKVLSGGQAVAYYPALARAVGGIAPALFLQQVAHWDSTSTDGWVYRTQEELEEELAMSPKTQATCRRHLIDQGFLVEERRAKNRLHYKVQWDKVEAALQSLPTGRSRPARPGSLDLPDRKNSLEESNNKSNNKNSPRGTNAPKQDLPAKALTTLTVDRVKEVGFDPAPHQKQNWGKGWATYVYVAEGETPPTPEEQFAALGEIVAAAAGKGGKARYFLAVEDAVKRVADNVTPLRRPGERPTDLDSNSEEAAARRAEGYEFFFA